MGHPGDCRKKFFVRITGRDMFLRYGIRGQAEKTVRESEHAADAWGIPLQKGDTAALRESIRSDFWEK